MKEKLKFIMPGIVVILVLIGIIVFVPINRKSDEEILSESSIDVNDPVYANSNIYVKNGDVIIENADGGKVVATTKTLKKTNMEKVDEITKNNYKISNVNVDNSADITKVTGKITNNDSKKHKIQISAKFYKEDGKIAESNYTVVEKVKSLETKDFEIQMNSNLKDCKYKINVEYVD